MKRTRKLKHPASITQGTKKPKITRMAKQRPTQVKNTGEAVKVKGTGRVIRGRGHLNYSPPALVEKYDFRPDKYKLQIPAENLKKTNKDKALWVIGTGYGITLLPKNLVKQINKKTTLTFHNSYPYCNQFGINPTYWTWLDPSAAMPGLKHLNGHRVTNPPIPLIHPGLAGNGKSFRKYFGNTLCPFDKYHNHLTKVATQYPISLLPGTSLKALPNNEATAVYNNPQLRTDYGFLVGSAYKASVGKEQAAKAAKNAKLENGMYMTENKFSSYILPLAHYLGFKTVIYVGFEGTGPRFFEMNNHTIGAGRGGYDMGMENWGKWSKELGIGIYSLIPEGKSKTTQYFNYIKLEDALKKY